MNIEFYQSHMETLAELQKLAENHNCVITFGFSSNFDREIDKDILKKRGFSDKVLAEMNELTFEDTVTLFDKFWFNLFNKNDESQHSMVYIESNTYFYYSADKNDYTELSEELIKAFEEYDITGRIDEYTVNVCYNPTIIRGFGNEKKVEDYRVYRSGMALKFFGDLVCDYLNEPRIKRVY